MKRIIVIDDEYEVFEDQLRASTDMQGLDWQYDFQKDTESGTNRISVVNYDALVIDLEFSGKMDGIEFIRELRQNDYNLPVIVFSKHEDPRFIKESLSKHDLSADDFFSKLEIVNENRYNSLIKSIDDLTKKYSVKHEIASILSPDIRFENEAWSVWGKCKPYTDMGGDVLDICESGGTLITYLADVSGHGFTAGFFGGMIKSAIRTHLMNSFELQQAITSVNRVFYELNFTDRPKKYFTFCGAELNLDGRVKIYNAAHPFPFVFENHSNREIESHLPPLGIMSPGLEEIRCSEIQLDENSFIAIYSDGMSDIESRDDQNVDIKSIISSATDRNANISEKTIEEIFRTINSQGRPTDDQSLLIVRRKKNS